MHRHSIIRLIRIHPHTIIHLIHNIHMMHLRECNIWSENATFVQTTCTTLAPLYQLRVAPSQNEPLHPEPTVRSHCVSSFLTPWHMVILCAFAWLVVLWFLQSCAWRWCCQTAILSLGRSRCTLSRYWWWYSLASCSCRWTDRHSERINHGCTCRDGSSESCRQYSIDGECTQ